MNKKNLLALTIFIISIIFSWNWRLDIIEYFHSKHSIYWSKNADIKINDFKGKINKNSELNLYFYHGFYYKAYDVESAYVRAFFDKDKSWIKDSMNIYVNEDLKLEKLIFDLYECHARKFNYEIDLIRYDKLKRIKDIVKIGDKINQDLIDIQNQIYDSKNSLEDHITFWRKITDQMLIDTEELIIQTPKPNTFLSN